MKYIYIGLILLVVIIVGSCFIFKVDTFFRNQDDQNVVYGQRETVDTNPDFMLKSIGGNTIMLSEINSDFILVNFWAIRCPYCIMQMQDLITLNKKYKSSELRIVGVCLDNEPEKIKRIISTHDISYPIVISERYTHWKFGGIFGIPVTFLLNSDRDVIKKYTGFVSSIEINQDIDAMLN